MEDYLFRHFVDECRVVHEATSYLEIFNYSVGGLLTHFHPPPMVRGSLTLVCVNRIPSLIRARSMH